MSRRDKDKYFKMFQVFLISFLLSLLSMAIYQVSIYGTSAKITFHSTDSNVNVNIQSKLLENSLNMDTKSSNKKKSCRFVVSFKYLNNN